MTENTPESPDVEELNILSLAIESQANDNIAPLSENTSECCDERFVRNEKRKYEEDGEMLANQLVFQKIKDLEHYRKLRKTYAFLVFTFMCIWSALMFGIIINNKRCGLEVSDIVLTTLAGGTSISVIGLVGFIVQGLFNSSKKS